MTFLRGFFCPVFASPPGGRQGRNDRSNLMFFGKLRRAKFISDSHRPDLEGRGYGDHH